MSTEHLTPDPYADIRCRVQEVIARLSEEERADEASVAKRIAEALPAGLKRTDNWDLRRAIRSGIAASGTSLEGGGIRAGSPQLNREHAMVDLLSRILHELK